MPSHAHPSVCKAPIVRPSDLFDPHARRPRCSELPTRARLRAAASATNELSLLRITSPPPGQPVACPIARNTTPPGHPSAVASTQPLTRCNRARLGWSNLL
jgi:hypothetical protein